MPILQDLMESTLLQLSDHTFIYTNPNDMIIRIIILILIIVKSIRCMAISLKPMLVCEQKLTFRFLARLDYDLKWLNAVKRSKFCKFFPQSNVFWSSKNRCLSNKLDKFIRRSYLKARFCSFQFKLSIPLSESGWNLI